MLFSPPGFLHHPLGYLPAQASNAALAESEKHDTEDVCGEVTTFGLEPNHKINLPYFHISRDTPSLLGINQQGYLQHRTTW
jgi:hypothetical protein